MLVISLTIGVVSSVRRLHLLLRYQVSVALYSAISSQLNCRCWSVLLVSTNHFGLLYFRSSFLVALKSSSYFFLLELLPFLPCLLQVSYCQLYHLFSLICLFLPIHSVSYLVFGRCWLLFSCLHLLDLDQDIHIDPLFMLVFHTVQHFLSW